MIVPSVGFVFWNRTVPLKANGHPSGSFVSTAQTCLVGIPAALLNVLMCFLQCCPDYCGEPVAPTPPPFLTLALPL